MSVNTELQNLLTKMGGSPLESDTNSDLIKKISAAYDGSGGGSSSGGNVTFVPVVAGATEQDPNVIQMEAGDLLTACKAGAVFLFTAYPNGSSCALINSSYLGDEGYVFVANGVGFAAADEDDFPTQTGFAPK